MIKDFINKFKNPSSEFRGAPFWAWNNKLNPEELKEQISIFKEMGFGGFFMHSRIGLKTKYLGREWFQCISTCIEEAHKNNMYAWLYDEDRWPSGAAGGVVTADPQFRARSLIVTMLSYDVPLPEGKWDAVFAGQVENYTITNVRKLNYTDEPISTEETRISFSVQLQSPSDWFNGSTYVDVLNKEAIQKFIKTTHEAYAKRVNIASQFGKTIPGIFSDEPTFFEMPINNGIPWTNQLPEEFKKMYQYSIWDHLLELFFIVDGKEFSQVRLNYHNLLTHMFNEAYPKQIGKWCEKHHLEFTGHVFAEDSLGDQTKSVGSAMRYYEHVQAPGVDLLTEHWNVFDTIKQCVSVAHQFGRKRRISETYGCTGWDFSFMGHKALGDWQFALGINYRCQHLAWYSMEAEAKRDFPASISYQSPWHKEYRFVEDYFARLGAALDGGEEIRDLLVIHPVESVWGVFLYSDRERDVVRQLNAKLPALRNFILKHNIDFDYGDEEIMSRHASVENGRLNIAKAGYRCVVIPELLTIRKTTLQILDEFREAGGIVVYLGSAPILIDGISSNEAIKVYSKFVHVTFDTIISIINSTSRQVSITDESGDEIEPILHALKQSENISKLFCCNLGMNIFHTEHEEINKGPYDMKAPRVINRNLKFSDVTIRLCCPEDHYLYELDLSTGDFFKIQSRYENSTRIFKTSFEKLESHFFLTSNEKISCSEKPAVNKKLQLVGTLPKCGWNIVRSEMNAIVLDHPQYSIDGGPESELVYILKLDDTLREKLGRSPRGGAMIQPWVSENSDKTPERFLNLILKYTFECVEVPEADCFLVLERPELYDIEINGEVIEKKDYGFWCDKVLRKLLLPSQKLKKGINHLVIRGIYHEYLPGLEAMFLLGEFGVINNSLVKVPKLLDCGDWCKQGFPYYSGNMIYTSTISLDKYASSLYLCIPEWRGVALGVKVNNSSMHILWSPYRIDISPFVHIGDNIVEITIFGHRRNVHGPFYINKKWPDWTGPEQFCAYESMERNLVPCGLLESPIVET